MKIQSLIFLAFFISPCSFAVSPADIDYKEIATKAFNSRYTLSKNENDMVISMGQHAVSEGFIEQQAEWRRVIGEQIGVSDWSPENAQSESSNVSPEFTYSERPILFVSESVPELTLRNYVADLELVGGVLVLRGFIDGMSKIEPTLSFINRISVKKPGCTEPDCDRFNVPVLIDPILFKEYKVSRVPSLAVHGATNLSAYCNGTEGLNPGGHLVYGDSSLRHMIEILQKHQPEKDLTQIINALGSQS